MNDTIARDARRRLAVGFLGLFLALSLVMLVRLL